MPVVKMVSLAALIGVGTLLSGCATKESAERAQASADLADSDAKAAKGAADRAQSTADGANKTAQDALAAAQGANQRIDKLVADLEAQKHHASRHHRRHHVAAANLPTCPPVQQKSELTPHKKSAAVTLRQKTAQY